MSATNPQRFNMIPRGQPNPEANGLYVRFEDWQAMHDVAKTSLADQLKIEAEAQALREEVAQQKFLTKVENDALKMMTDKANELKSEVEQLEEELESLRARVVVVQDWQPLTAVGQVEIGDLLRFTIGGKEIEVSALLVIAPGDPKEEIIYNRGKNHYFITSMAVDGTSSHKNVMVKRHNGKTVSEGLLRRLLDSDGIDGIFDAQQNYAAHQELRALLNQDMENGNG